MYYNVNEVNFRRFDYKKRILFFTLALTLVIGLALPCFADSGDKTELENGKIIVDGICYSSDMKTLISCTELFDDDTFTVPDGVREIRDMAFYASAVKSVTMADSVKTIGKNAFLRSSIESIRFNKNSQLESIKDGAFEDCSFLKVIFLPEHPINIAPDAFAGCESLNKGLISIWHEHEQDAGTIETGDVNGDYFITASDARIVLRMAAKIDSVSEYGILFGDINRDGEITAADARSVLRTAAKLEAL